MNYKDLIREIWKINILEKFLVKQTLDKDFGTFISKLPPNHYQYPIGTFRKTFRHGISYELDISDIVDWFIYYGFNDISRTKLYSFIKKDNIVFDIGANVGDVSLHFAKLVGNRGIVHSFEPDSTNYCRFQRNLNINKFSNIILNKKGLGNKNASYKIYTLNEKNKGMNRIINDSKESNEYREIQVITLDEYCETSNIKNIDLIKIDVEGFELNVLKGGIHTINNFHPTLFIELDDQNLVEQGDSAKDLVLFLEEKGYYSINASTNQIISNQTDFSNCHYDIICHYTKTDRFKQQTL